MTDVLQTGNRRVRVPTGERRAAERALRAAERRKDEFLATLAHELRNPLAPMVNAMRMIRGATTGPEAEHAVEIIDRQLSQMVRLVDDLLDVSRMRRGKLAVRRQPLDLAEVLGSAIETARPTTDAAGHRLDVHAPQAAVYIDGDAVRLAQVFANLLSNAAKYTPPGGRIEIRVDTDADRVAVAVTDTGVGMGRETLDSLFVMFSQGRLAALDPGQSGLGVGLALSKRIVELHGGTITGASAGRGLGSRFTVTLPRAERRTLPPQASPAPARQARRRRVLLVDDNVDFARSLGTLLEALGHDVRVTHSAEDALAEAVGQQPEIAFLDIGLPGVSGLELATMLKALPEGAGTRLIALSGWGQEEDRARSRQAGFADHLVKPVDLAAIEATLGALPDEDDGPAPGRGRRGQR